MTPSTRHSRLLDSLDIVDRGGPGPVVALAHGAGGGIDANFTPVFDAAGGSHRWVGPTIRDPDARRAARHRSRSTCWPIRSSRPPHGPGQPVSR